MVSEAGILAVCGAFPGLQALDLTYCDAGGTSEVPTVNDASAAAIGAQLTCLTCLLLACSPYLGDAGLGALCGLPRLARLQLNSFPSATEAGIRQLSRLTALTQLCLERAAVALGDCLSGLTRCSALAELSFKDCGCGTTMIRHALVCNSFDYYGTAVTKAQH